jgi:CheY-like chemotaxis protein
VRLLLVEDSAMNARLMEALLQQRGHEVVIAEDAPSAIARIGSDRDFHGALVDLNLPGGGGVAVVDALRRAQVSLPALAVTGTSEPGIEARLREQGFAGYLPKPVDPQTFAQTVERLLAAPAPAPRPATRLAALKATYRAKLPSLIEEVAEAVRDPALALGRAHQLAGLAGSYGFWRVTQAARELEHALAAGATEVGALVVALRAALTADLEST